MSLTEMFGTHQTSPTVPPATTMWNQTSLTFHILMPQLNASKIALGTLTRPWGQRNTHSKWLLSHFTGAGMGEDFKQKDLSYWRKGYLKAAEAHMHLAFPSVGVLPKWGAWAEHTRETFIGDLFRVEHTATETVVVRSAAQGQCSRSWENSVII